MTISADEPAPPRLQDDPDAGTGDLLRHAADLAIEYREGLPDRRVGHSELTVSNRHGDATWMMSDEHPEIQVEAPQPDRGNAVTLHLEVDDVDGVVEAMVKGGAVLDRGPEDNPVGRVAVVRDPFGHRWFLNRPAAARSP